MRSIDLTPEQLRFAESRIETGRFGSLAEVVSAALDLLKRDEARRDALWMSLDEARRRGEEEGWVELDEALASMDAVIDRIEAAQTKGA